MKDNDNKYRWFEGMHTLQEMINTTEEKLFSCGSYVKATPQHRFQNGEQATNVVQLQTLGSFHTVKYGGARNSTSHDFVSPIYPLAEWALWLSKHNAIDIPITTADLVPICYGGVFMTTIAQIQKAPVGTWQPVIDSLSRGDNIEEGHFMERMWAVLFSPPIPHVQKMALLDKKVRIVTLKSFHPLTGLLVIKDKDYDKIQKEKKKKKNSRKRKD
jgi:hypothetical protein